MYSRHTVTFGMIGMLFVCGCDDRGGDADLLDRQLNLAFEAPAEDPAAGLASAQLELFRRLERDDDSAAGLMTISFILMDDEAPRTAADARTVTARNFGTPQFAYLGHRFAPGTLPDGELEIHTFSDTRALVVVHHAEGRPAITRWTRTSDGWRATSLLVNAQEGTMESLRRSIAATPVQQ